MSDRIEILKNSVNNAIRAICPERAILWTEYYKNKLNRNKPVEIQAAEAMCYVLNAAHEFTCLGAWKRPT